MAEITQGKDKRYNIYIYIYTRIYIYIYVYIYVYLSPSIVYFIQTNQSGRTSKFHSGCFSV